MEFHKGNNIAILADMLANVKVRKYKLLSFLT
jgi:hypothetical protein